VKTLPRSKDPKDWSDAYKARRAAGYNRMVALTDDAFAALQLLQIHYTIKYNRRVTYSEALTQALDDVTDESNKSDLGLVA
jgi:hypothetical protein